MSVRVDARTMRRASIATKPKAEGSIRRARMIELANRTICVVEFGARAPADARHCESAQAFRRRPLENILHVIHRWHRWRSSKVTIRHPCGACKVTYPNRVRGLRTYEPAPSFEGKGRNDGYWAFQCEGIEGRLTAILAANDGSPESEAAI